ncbi:MAG: DUF445 domain-containing protein [Verrucomicrobia bacterium]|nr:DUF445 domain-containing protein [Verrucomicrobiota bacterium]
MNRLSKEQKAADLRRLRFIATGLLVAMSVVYVVARTFEPRAAWIGFVRAFAEAAMVGAMADWFAVVALFRHPLGLPIPHTAILRRKQVEVGQGLGNFVVENFLTREIVGRRLAKMDLTGTATAWLRDHSGLLADKVLSFVPRLLDAIDDDDVTRVVYKQFLQRASTIPAAPALAKALSLLTSGAKHEALLSQALQFGDSLVQKNRHLLQSGIMKELPVPEKIGPVSLQGVREMLADYIANKVVHNVQGLLHDVGANPEHPLREEFGRRLVRFIHELETSEEYRARGEEIKSELLANPVLHDYAGSVWGQLKEAVKRDLATPEPKLRRHFVALVTGVAGAVHDDAPMRARLNDGIRNGVLDFVEANAKDIGQLIEETVKGWNADEMTAKLELEVGRDLQFIRLNGTVIGGAIGVLIHLAGLLIWKH